MDKMIAKAFEHLNLARAEGFDWPNASGVLDKLEEELNELRQAYVSGSAFDIKDEFGDVLFTLLCLAMHLSIDVKPCLSLTIDKFATRYQAMKHISVEMGLDFKSLSLEKKEDLWQEVKKRRKPRNI